MTDEQLNNLAGRIDGISWAVLHLTAELEQVGIIDGPRLSAKWRGAVQPHSSDTEMRRASGEYLHKLAHLLDEARSQRQSRLQPE